MARVTVEDCVRNVPNRFELVLLAAKRAREILAGAPLTVSRDNDKNPVVALREISEETISLDVLREGLLRGMQRHISLTEIDADEEVEEEIQNLVEMDSAWETHDLTPAEEEEQGGSLSENE